MHDVVEMTILHPRDNLMEEPPGFVGVQPAFGDDVIEELAVGLFVWVGGWVGGWVDDSIRHLEREAVCPPDKR